MLGFHEGIHRSSVNQGPLVLSFGGFFYVSVNKLLNKRWSYWCLEKSYVVTIMIRNFHTWRWIRNCLIILSIKIPKLFRYFEKTLAKLSLMLRDRWEITYYRKRIECGYLSIHCVRGRSRWSKPVAQIPQCTSPISHNAPFCNRNVYMYAHFCYTWWRHQMETFSALLAFVRGIHWSPVNSPHRGQWRGALMFSLICVWINGGVNNRETGDLTSL